jgi:phosphoribosylglycinamide formyltransferase 2
MLSSSRIGTPLSPSATKVMLLGAGELGKEVIISLQRLGIEVIAVDRYANAPGHQVAHRAHVIDMTDGEALKALIELEQPDLIVPEIEAIATQTLLELEKDGKVVVIPTARAICLTMNREGIRRLAAEELGLPTSPYRFADNLATLKTACSDIGFPCIIKPVMSSSGKGQSTINGIHEVEAAWHIAATAGRVDTGRVIVEGFIDFDYEITQLTVRALDKEGKTLTHFCEPIGHVQVNGAYVESWQPHPMHPVALAKSCEIAKKITDNLGGLGVFGVELFVKDDQVWFSEVSPRPHDTGMVTMASQVQSEFELHAKAILGMPINLALHSPAASAVIYGGHDAKAIAFEGINDALSISGTDIRLFGKPESFARRRMGVILTTADNIEVARQRAKEAAAKINTVVTV